jgi:hypothetical protein
VDSLKQSWSQLQRPAQIGVAIAAGLITLMVVWQVLPAIFAGMGFGLLLMLFIGPYWIPTIIAFVRKHPSKGAVLALNLLAGWTFVGWVVSLVWSLSNNASTGNQTVIVNNNTAAPAPVAYQVGDVVNGQRFNGTTWTPIAAASEGAAPAAALEAAEPNTQDA